MKFMLKYCNFLVHLVHEFVLQSKSFEWHPKAVFEQVFALKYLLAVGFLITIIPVIIALSYAGSGMRETASLGENSLYQTAEQIKVMRLILQQVNDIERKAKLYVLFSDPTLRQPYERESYENVRNSLHDTMNELLRQSVDNRLTLLISELMEKERLIHDQITGVDERELPKLPVEQAFRGLRGASDELWQEVTGRVGRQAEGLHQQANELEKRLLIRTLTLLTLSVGFFVAFMVVVHRSILRLDQAIRRLGAGRFGDPIEVKGPKDLRQLGDRLEWLRLRLLDLEHAKQQFMENVTREIALPLAGIGADAERLVMQADKTAELAIRDTSLRLSRHAEKLQTVCDELVRYTRINENPVLAERTSIELKQLLDEVISDYQSLAQAKSLRIKALAQRVEFHGLAEQIRGIFEHLVDNAVKFSPEGGEIRIMLRVSSACIEFEVEDDGCGISAEERQQVLKPFFRGKAARELGTEGAGLGLAIVNEYLVHCQGRLEIVDPREDHHGARIRVQIPIANSN